MKNLASKLIEFYEKLVGQDTELKDYSLVENRLEELRDIENSEGELDLTETSEILDSILDAFCLSLLSGNLEFSDKPFEFGLNDVNNIGDKKDRKRMLNATSSNCKPLLFENRVRAWYSNLCGKVLEDMDSKYENIASCEFILPLEDRKQLVECKSFKSYSINDSKEWEDIEEKFENMEEKECQDIEETVRHLIIDITKCCGGFSQENSSGTKYNGCKDEKIEEIEQDVLKKASNFKVDRISLVSYNIFRNKELDRAISERTKVVKSQDDSKGAVGYNGWTLTTRVRKDNKDSFKDWKVFTEGKKPDWLNADIDAKRPNQVFFRQQAAEEIPDEKD